MILDVCLVGLGCTIGVQKLTLVLVGGALIATNNQDTAMLRGGIARDNLAAR